MENRQVALVTRCLWEFQEMTSEIDGLILVNVDGAILTSTLTYSESTDRVAAVASTLVALARQVSEEWERGDFNEVRVRYRDQHAQLRDAQLIAVTDDAVLVIILQRTASLSLSSVTVPFNTRQALQYVAHVLLGDDNPPRAIWI